LSLLEALFLAKQLLLVLLIFHPILPQFCTKRRELILDNFDLGLQIAELLARVFDLRPLLDNLSLLEVDLDLEVVVIALHTLEFLLFILQVSFHCYRLLIDDLKVLGFVFKSTVPALDVLLRLVPSIEKLASLLMLLLKLFSSSIQLNLRSLCLGDLRFQLSLVP